MPDHYGLKVNTCIAKENQKVWEDMHGETGKPCRAALKDDDLPFELRWPENWPKTCEACIEKNDRKNVGDEFVWVNGSKC